MSKETKKKLFSAKREEREASQERIGAMVRRTKTLEHDKDCGIMRWPRGSWAKEEGELHVNKAKPMWRMRAGGTAVMGNMVGISAWGGRSRASAWRNKEACDIDSACAAWKAAWAGGTSIWRTARDRRKKTPGGLLHVWVKTEIKGKGKQKLQRVIGSELDLFQSEYFPNILFLKLHLFFF